MLTPKKSLTFLVTAITLATTGGVLAQTPAGYPADYNKIIEAAKKKAKW